MRWQAVFYWNGHGWSPKRGIHSGLVCADCGSTESDVMYEGKTKVLCDECKKRLTDTPTGS